MHARLTAVLLVAAASASLLAQGDQAPAPSGQTFRAAVNLVRVDMYATQDGAAVEDLRAREVEVLEDGVPQTIDSFEFVKVAPAGPQETRREPSTVAEMRELTREARARVFVIFLDTYHTQADGSANMRIPLVRFLDRVLGEDDLVALMTPEMNVNALTFARKTTILSDIVNEEWWGRRESITRKDPKEFLYEECFPEPREARPLGDRNSIAQQMIDRRREMLTMDALEDLVAHLRDLREERKAVLTVTEGWRLFTESRELTRVDRRDQMAGFPPVGIRGGQVALPEPAGASGVVNYAECDADQAVLATLDHVTRMRRITEEANRGNVSFYPVFARGLTALDSPIGPRRPPTPAEDRAILSARQNSMRELADMTDGTAVINTNAIDAALARIAADLSSYYLFSYYSTNQRLDGRFREITVRVNRPGVRVRARRGYRGLTAADLTGGSLPPGMQPLGGSAGTAASAITVDVNPRASFRVRTSGWTIANGAAPIASVWVVGELDAATRRELAWTAGATADVSVVAATGGEVVSTSVDIPAADAGFTLRLPAPAGLAPGEYAVRIRVQPNGDGSLPVSDTVRLIVPATPSALGEPVLWRRGLSTGPRFAATADPRFRRGDRIRLELPTTGDGSASARMLDRLGRPMQVPVQVSSRQDPSGQFRWIVAEAALAPLAPGDYAIEVTLGDARQVGAFRVVP